ncbi:MAG: DUF1801 domain-containing protein [Pseudomonadota bacterium]
MAGMVTVETDADPWAFLDSVENDGRAEDARVVTRLMADVTGWPPRMWGDSIIGFGRYEYTRADRSRHQFLRVGLSPRKANLTVYLMPGVKNYADQLALMGKYKNSVSCLYLGRLKGLNLDILGDVIGRSVEDMARMYPEGS